MKGTRRLLGLVVVGIALSWVAPADAQERGQAPRTPEADARIDMTGNWVSIVTEDWRWRMVEPLRGDYASVPLTPEGVRVADLWNPEADRASGNQCKAYGVGGIMRRPGRLRIAWADPSTLRIELDAGTQTRLLRFGSPRSSGGGPTWQGHSVAQWNVAGRSLKVVTTNLRPGYVRKNGAPYSSKATVTEYWDLHALPNGDRWLTVTTRVDDPAYFTRPYITSSDFRRLPGAAGWNPTPCSSR